MNFDLGQEAFFSSRVLVVDDDPGILDYITKTAGARFDLATAASGGEGLAMLAEQGPFGLVISDMRMPDMDGIDFLNQVRQRWPLAVRILYTGYADTEAALAAINTSHVFRLITKPAHNRDLLQAMEEGLKHHRLLAAEQAHIIERERQFRSAVMDLPLPAMIHAEGGEVLILNQAWQELSGWSQEDLPDIQSWVQKALGDDWPRRRRELEDLWQLQGSASQGEMKIHTKQGKTLVWDFNSAPLCNTPDGRRTVISIASDVTQRREMEDSLSRAGQVFANATNGILITDSQGVILDVNPAFCHISGFTREELIGERPDKLRSGRHDRDFYRAMWNSLLEDGAWRGEVWNRRKNGEIHPVWLTISRVGGDQGVQGYVAINSDLSALREAQERMEYLAHHDSLTGLPNRALLRDRLEQALAYAQQQERQVVVSYLDLDQFKLLNESLGHNTGDWALTEVARRLRQALGEADTLVRWGGDHFVAMSLTSRGSEYAVRVAERLLASLASPLDIKGHKMFITACVGQSLYPGDAASPEVLIQHADTAMHAAKQTGRGQYKFFDESMNHEVVARLSMENDMRAALEKGQFTLLYQPQVELATGAVKRVEALVRWNHPSQGLLMPGAFLSVAEDSGLIVPMGLQILRMACAQMRLWEEQGIHLERMAVNLSARQMWEKDLVETVTRIMTESGCAPSRLELEVTESVVMASVQRGGEVLERLRAAGVHTSIDDFGTGYSSLYYLKKLPFHTLKIDKSFVDDIPDDRDSMNIVEYVANLAHGLGKEVVVEGVETRRQMETVAALGCEMVQGFYFASPLDPEQLRALLAGGPRPFAHLLPGGSPT